MFYKQKITVRFDIKSSPKILTLGHLVFSCVGTVAGTLSSIAMVLLPYMGVCSHKDN